MLCSAKIYAAIAQGSGFFQHGHTYLGHPVAAAAALAVIDEIERQELVSKVAALGPTFLSTLSTRLAEHPYVGNIRGRGFFAGVELVADKATKQPLNPSLKIHAKLKQRAFENGLMIYPMGGTIDGQSGDHVLLAPPFIASRAELGEITELLCNTLDDVFAECMS